MTLFARVTGVSTPAIAGVFFLCCALCSPAFSAPPMATGTAEAGGIALLQQASDAWRTGNFRGRIVYVRGNRVESMQVVHAVFDGIEHERISHLDETATEIIRRGDETICIHPDARMTQLDAAGSSGPFRTFAALDAGIDKVYAVQRKAASRVAGRTADYLELVPRDAHRYGYRVWLDMASRLPLRYEVVSRQGRALESVEFVDLETGISIPRDLFLPPTAAAAARTLTITRVAEAPLPDVVPSWLPEGFRVTGSRLHQDGQKSPVSAVTYSDGVAAFSFFVEAATTAAQPVGRQFGPTVVVSGVLDAGKGKRFLVTLVGELPAGTAVKIVESTRLSKTPAGKTEPQP